MQKWVKENREKVSLAWDDHLNHCILPFLGKVCVAGGHASGVETWADKC